MKSYECEPCGYVYDPAVGDPDNGIAPGTAFEDLPEDTHKERFNPYLGTDRRELLPQVEEQLLTEIAAAWQAISHQEMRSRKQY